MWDDGTTKQWVECSWRKFAGRRVTHHRKHATVVEELDTSEPQGSAQGPTGSLLVMTFRSGYVCGPLRLRQYTNLWGVQETA